MRALRRGEHHRPMSSTITSAAPERRIDNPVQGDSVVFLQTAAETGGERSVLDLHVVPGGGNEPHRHLTYAEHFEVLRGTLTVEVGGRMRRLGAGERASAPAGTLHRWRNDTQELAIARVTLEPGHRGMEQVLQIGYGLARDGRTRTDGVPKDLRLAALLAELGEIRVGGALGLLRPVLGLLARGARRRGAERELIERYVRF
jgi:mannose-6-phosphate isomerase-like protein (cupin superfamily)